MPLLLTALLSSPAGTRATAAAACQDGSTYTHFNLETTQVLGSCNLIFGNLAPFLGEVKVVLYTAPVGTVRFSLPDPPFGSVIGETWNFPFTGDRVNGMEMELGGCLSEVVVLGTLTIFSSTGVGGCLPWKVDDRCEAEACNGELRPAVAPSFNISDPGVFCDDCFQRCQSLPPYDLNPPDGATEVLPGVAFSWSGPPGITDPALECYIRISTDPACGSGEIVVVPCDTRTISLEFLELGTTYHWQAGWRYLFGSGCSSGNFGESAIHSFTTSTVVAVEHSTWGRVKALYRE
ncbi:MAG TPA: hypothetical protein VFT13_13085 [Candidatus Krumholzibacteria bacterium]|nr:hypothetical protein [Candidatus Krumholzibacteria bacterium]